MLSQDAYPLLKKSRPFDSLDDGALKEITREMLLEYHPKGHVILRQNGPPAQFLSIIKTGAVRLFITTNDGEEVPVGYRTAGDFFGMLSFVHGDVSPETIVAAEETICYLIRKEVVLALIRSTPVFSEFFMKSVLTRLVHITYRDIRDRSLLSGGDKLLFTNALSDLAEKNVVTAPEDISIQQAAEIMAERRIGSLVLLDKSGLPSGMITDKDLRNKVVARGRDPAGRVGDIMSVTIIKSAGSDYCYEGLLKMMRYNIHHLLLVEKGELAGIITSHDLMMLQGTSPLSVGREIESQTTIDGLALVAPKINNMISAFIREEAKASTITRIITEINDRLLRRILALTEQRMGSPPVGYCWIVYGSEGRKEQTFKTDQDNAIVYGDLPGREEEAAAYFADFSGRAREALIRCGFPACRADYMASNPRWRQPLSVWKKYFSAWINTPTPEAILNALIFFDFRAVHGDLLLAEKLRAYIAHEIRGKKQFLGHMAGHAVKNRPPIGVFGSLLRKRGGPHPGTIDIKINGLSPVIDAARLSALETGVFHTATMERLREVRGRSACIAGACCRDLEQVFEFVMAMRLKHQFRQIQAGIAPDNFIDPDGLATLEKKMLKEAFKIIEDVQDTIMKVYSGYVVR